jgi:hypothetical protein
MCNTVDPFFLSLLCKQQGRATRSTTGGAGARRWVIILVLRGDPLSVWGGKWGRSRNTEARRSNWGCRGCVQKYFVGRSFGSGTPTTSTHTKDRGVWFAFLTGEMRVDDNEV